MPRSQPQIRRCSPTITDAHCVKGCYRCLLSYYNQPDHELIDRTDEAVEAHAAAAGPQRGAAGRPSLRNMRDGDWQRPWSAGACPRLMQRR